MKRFTWMFYSSFYKKKKKKYIETVKGGFQRLRMKNYKNNIWQLFHRIYTFYQRYVFSNLSFL